MYSRDHTAPTTESLEYLGFEDWQIKLVRQLPPDMQWEAHDEYVRRLMSGGDLDRFVF